jgi:hypothetical protein
VDDRLNRWRGFFLAWIEVEHPSIRSATLIGVRLSHPHSGRTPRTLVFDSLGHPLQVVHRCRIPDPAQRYQANLDHPLAVHLDLHEPIRIPRRAHTVAGVLSGFEVGDQACKLWWSHQEHLAGLFQSLVLEITHLIRRTLQLAFVGSFWLVLFGAGSFIDRFTLIYIGRLDRRDAHARARAGLGLAVDFSTEEEVDRLGRRIEVLREERDRVDPPPVYGPRPSTPASIPPSSLGNQT